MKEILKNVVGFRTEKKWKMVVASIYYVFCLLLMVAVGVGAFLIIATIPFIIFAIISIIKDKNKKKALITLVCGILLFSVGIKSDNTREVNEANAKQVIAQNKIITDKKAKEVAKAKVISDAKAKKISDEKAIEDKKLADAQAIKDAETARLQAIEDKKVEDARIAKEAKDAQDIINKNTRTFSSGEYTVGTHLDAGAYEFTFIGSGNLTVYGADGTLLSNEIGGSNMGVSKYRSILTDRCKIKISGMQMKVVPTNRSLVAYGNINLHAGYWIVGQDVTKGRYTASTKSDSGNFVIYSSNGSPKTNEILGVGEYAVKETVIDLDDGDIISISSLNSVNFKPTK